MLKIRSLMEKQAFLIGKAKISRGDKFVDVIFNTLLRRLLYFIATLFSNEDYFLNHAN
ncbi:hypothetical protein CPS_0515 [Colwellia psychrerythraea 34H]|uniref:Uncharacterized protein n=1 Tax=Colwellia psychrerythraea (strain 34H / ATCC BAA-681) TaxID=167879 RepID=Q489J1_COLP3|nr:hypothetical protein CPS_0515 [Colwellia psychrerythraea 34H]